MGDRVAELKDEANALFAAADYDKAFDKYGDALQLTTDPAIIAVLRGNRAQVRILAKSWNDAKVEATHALIADQGYLKGWNRLARAYLGMGWTTEATTIFQLALRSPVFSSTPANVTALSEGLKDTRAAERAIKPNEFIVNLRVEEELATKAARLKDEGNALVGSSPPDYEGAYSKFTLAIALDPSSAVLRCNRAYCANSLRLWQLALDDARVAITISPDYIKAWARLGAAHDGMKAYAESKEAFARALELLNKLPEPLSPAYNRLKASIEQSLLHLQTGQRVASVVSIPSADSPFARAKQLINLRIVPEIKSTWYSSTWVLLQAYDDYTEGIKAMSELEIRGDKAKGRTTALESISNAIACDSRAFYSDSPDWVERYEAQAQYELTASRGWFEATTAEELMSLAQHRLRTEGWSNGQNSGARIAIATTIRAWFNNAFIYDRAGIDHQKALMVYEEVVKFIEAGRSQWSNVPPEDRGAIFKLTFQLGVERCYLDCLCGAVKARNSLPLTPDTPGYLERLKALAEKMIAQAASLTARDITPQHPPNFVLAFMYYPEAQAHHALGLYYSTKHEERLLRDDFSLLHKAAEHYGKAAEIYPEDDEYCTESLYQKLVALFMSGHSLRATLPAMDALAASMDKTKPIWEHSASSTVRTAYQRIVWFADDARKGMEKGDFTLDDQILPDFLLPQRR